MVNVVYQGPIIPPSNLESSKNAGQVTIWVTQGSDKEVTLGWAFVDQHGIPTADRVQISARETPDF
jgi:hypothetical protein